MIQILTGYTVKENGAIDLTYTKATPKTAAAFMLARAIDGFVECIDLEDYAPEMTVRERELVMDQMIKLQDRLLKMLGE